MEILVSYAAYDRETPTLQQEYPRVLFHCAERLAVRSSAGSRPHADLDILRSEGLARARGTILALTEDHACVSKHWAQNMVRAHEADCAAAGGAIENEVDRLLNWAVYFCDFFMYQNPVPSGPSERISDINISYKRSALESVRDVWKDKFHEPQVNGTLFAAGQTLSLSEEILLFQHRDDLRMAPAVYERYLWGRYYAVNRISGISAAKRTVFALLSPILPAILVARIAHNTLARRRSIVPFLRALPLIIMLACCWSFGEFTGYVTGKDAPPQPELKGRGLRRIAANFTVLSAAELLSKIVTFFAFALLARVLGPTGFGSIEFTIALLVFFLLFTDFGSSPYGAREIARHPERTAGLIGSIVTLRFLLAATGYALLSAFAFLAVPEHRLRQLILVYGLSLFAAPGFLQWVFQGFDRMRLVALGSLARQSVFAVLVLLLIRRPEHVMRVAWMECAAVGTLAVANLILLKMYFGHISVRPRFAGIRETVRQSLPIGLSELTWASTWYFPTVLLGILVGGSVVGWFGAALRPVMTLHAFVWLYFYNMLPALSRCVDQPRESLRLLVGQSLSLTAWAAVFLGVAGMLFADPALVLVFGPGYAESVLTFRILIWVLPIALLSGHYRYALIAFNHQRYEFLSSLYTAVLSVGLGAWLIPRYGSEGAAVALLVAAIFNWALAHRYVQVHIDRIPALSHLLKPLLAGGTMCAVFLLLRTWNLWAAGAASIAVFAILFATLQPEIRRVVG